jgi:Fis family transcriptional regulator
MVLKEASNTEFINKEIKDMTTNTLHNPSTHLHANPHAVPSIREALSKNLENYFHEHPVSSITQLHNLIIEQVEAPLLESLMRKFRYNQSKVSKALGLSRGTTRKLLKKYGLID